MITFNNATYQRIIESTVNKSHFINQMHPRFELLYILNGNGKFIIEDTEYPFTNNSMFLVAPGKFHVLSEPPKSDYDRIIIYFDENLLPSVLPKGITFHSLTNSNMRELFLKFDGYCNKYDGDALSILFNAFLCEALITSHSPGGESNKLPKLIKNAIKFVEVNLDKNLSVDIIANELFVSKTHLSHSFSKIMNIGIMGYVELKRVYKARELLKNGYSPTKVAEMLNYKSYPTFLRNYKKHFSVNPSNDKIKQ
ncbi:MAG: AraC family transcriptional regulator [Clostridia bacterium]|nr:AraC family transcriptional regulator [Clostridia bacterium]